MPSKAGAWLIVAPLLFAVGISEQPGEETRRPMERV
jgi:hypothetical protein